MITRSKSLESARSPSEGARSDPPEACRPDPYNKCALCINPASYTLTYLDWTDDEATVDICWRCSKTNPKQYQGCQVVNISKNYNRESETEDMQESALSTSESAIHQPSETSQRKPTESSSELQSTSSMGTQSSIVTQSSTVPQSSVVTQETEKQTIKQSEYRNRGYTKRYMKYWALESAPKTVDPHFWCNLE